MGEKDRVNGRPMGLDILLIQDPRWPRTPSVLLWLHYDDVCHLEPLPPHHGPAPHPPPHTGFKLTSTAALDLSLALKDESHVRLSIV